MAAISCFAMKLRTVDQCLIRLASSAVEKSGLKTKILVSPAARLLLSVNGISADQVSPSGPKGHILKGDVLQHLKGSSINQQFPRQVSMLVTETDLKQLVSLFGKTNLNSSQILAQALCKCFSVASGNPMLTVRIHESVGQTNTRRLGDCISMHRSSSSEAFLELFVDCPPRSSNSAAVASIQSQPLGGFQLSITINRSGDLDSSLLMKSLQRYLCDPLLLLL